ncbi:hypothetical protein Trydic_g15066 [Trypoxylus dichotomus]
MLGGFAGISIQFGEERAPPTSCASRRGRPCMDYGLSSARSKHKKAIRLFRESRMEHFYMQGLRSIGEPKHAAIFEQLCFLSKRAVDVFLKNLMKGKPSKVP